MNKSYLMRILLVFKFLIVLFLLQSCTDSKHIIKDVKFKVNTVDFIISSSFLSYSDDFNGGSQETVTINATYPGMKPDLDKSINNLGLGKGVRILLSHRHASPSDAWGRFSKFLGDKIIGTEIVHGLTKHLTPKTELFDHYTYSKGHEIVMIISCPKRSSPHNRILCKNNHKIINDNIYVSYLFSERLLSEVSRVDSRVEKFILGITYK